MSDVVLASILESIQSGSLNVTTATMYLVETNATVMDPTDVAILLSAMSNSQVKSVFEALTGSKNPNIGPGMVRTLWVLIALSTIVLAARLSVKWRMTRRIFYDDAAMISALLFGYLHAIFMTETYRHGFGKHLLFLTTSQRERCFHMGYISVAWGMLSTMFGRIAFLVSLMFVSGVDPSIKKWTIYTFIILQLLVNVCACLVMYGQCGSHLDVIWKPDIWANYTKYCWDPSVQSDYGYFLGAFNSLTDLFLTALPAIMIFNAKISVRQKLGIAFLLCLGILAFIASIVKTYESKALAEIADYTYDLVPYVIWMSIELNVVIMVASIPLLRPIFHGILYRVLGSLAKHGPVQEKFESISLGSILSKSKGRTTEIPSSSSQEHIAPQQDPFTITQTVEVEVTTGPNHNITMVHAALVGLVDDGSKAARVWH